MTQFFKLLNLLHVHGSFVFGKEKSHWFSNIPPKNQVVQNMPYLHLPSDGADSTVQPQELGAQ